MKLLGVFFAHLAASFGCPDFSVFCPDGEKILLDAAWSWSSFGCKDGVFIGRTLFEIWEYGNFAVRKLIFTL